MHNIIYLYIKCNNRTKPHLHTLKLDLQSLSWLKKQGKLITEPTLPHRKFKKNRNHSTSVIPSLSPLHRSNREAFRSRPECKNEKRASHDPMVTQSPKKILPRRARPTKRYSSPFYRTSSLWPPQNSSNQITKARDILRIESSPGSL